MREGIDGWSPIERRNFIANVMDGAFFAFGLSFVSQQTVLPVFVRNIGGGNMAVALLPVIWTFGFNFTQIAIVTRAHAESRKKSLLLKTSMVQRLPWLLMALLAFFVLPRVGGEVALVLFMAAFALAATGGGVNLPVWFDLVADLTPLRRRGRLFALRTVAGALLGIAGGGITTAVLAFVSFPLNCALLASMAFLTMMLSYYFLTRLVEPHAETPPAPAVHRLDGKTILAMVRTGTQYRNFLIGDALIIVSTMGNAFFTLYALERFHLPDAYAGTFTIVIMLGVTVGSIFFGSLADRKGHKVNMIISAGSVLCSSLIAIVAPAVEFFGLVFVLSSWSVMLGGISRLPFIAELCAPQERTTYVATSNLLTSPFILAGIVGGWMANSHGYVSVFVVSGVVAALAVIWWITMIEEPRSSAILATVR